MIELKRRALSDVVCLIFVQVLALEPRCGFRIYIYLIRDDDPDDNQVSIIWSRFKSYQRQARC